MPTKSEINRIDPGNSMFNALKNFPNQFDEAIQLCENAAGLISKKRAANHQIIIAGMGGSAIGGDLLKDYFQYSDVKNKFKINVVRDYEMPRFADEKTFFIISSYSGNTEETLTIAKEAVEMSPNIVCITSGGTLEKIATEKKLPLILLPKDLQPRCATGYIAVSMLMALIKCGFITKTESRNIMTSIEAARDTLKEMSENFSNYEFQNIAVTLAEMLKDSVPVVYSTNKFATANLRWRNQIQENAKTFAFGNLIPEMNHNEINAFDAAKDITDKVSVILFNDSTDNERDKKRIEIFKEILNDKVSTVIELTASSEDYLAKIFEYIYLGDWVSYYLAIARNVNPTPIPNIKKIKDFLAK